MAKIDRVQEVAVEKLVPYANNAKVHSEEQVEKIAASIQEFGFLSPCLIDAENNIIAGHGRVMAAKKLGMKTVPCVYIDGLTEEQHRAYILADNKLTELGEWDMGLVNAELGALIDADFDIDTTGFSVDAAWFEKRREFDNSNDGQESQEYQDFVEKFEPKRTTDDCYTPTEVYEAIADYVAEHYNVSRDKFVRPFFPGGDYQTQIYPTGSVVVDNPPFSILSEIVRFYGENGIKFFLFAPGLTTMSAAAFDWCAVLCTCASVVYENGAAVSTSFLTNLEAPEIKAKADPELYKIVSEAVDKVLEKMHEPQRKYSYPSEVVTAPMLARYSKYGVAMTITKDDCVRISKLDSQTESGDAIFGGGLLLSERAAAERAAAERAAAERAAAERAAAERAAAERAAAEVWQLSEREKEIVKSLGREASK